MLKITSMPPTPSRTRRVVLRALVLAQLAVLALVAFTVYELVSFGSEVTPGAVALVASMLASTVVALRVSLLRAAATRVHRLAFMSAQAITALAPLVGRTSRGFVVAGSALPRHDGFGPGFVIAMMGLELLLAAVLAAVSALLCPLLLASAPDSTTVSPFGRVVGAWASGAVLVAALVSMLYGAHVADTQKPETQVKQLLGSGDEEVRRTAARHLAAMDLSAQPAIRDALFDGLAAAGSVEQSWAAYVLIAAGADDGRAMKRLREMAGTFAVGRAVHSLAMLGAAAEPALAELTAVIRIRTSDALVAGIQVEAADALAAIGPPAVGAVPHLLERARDQAYPELRFAAGHAIDRIDPGFARRCAVDAPTMLEALAHTNLGALTIRPECLPPAAPSLSGAL